MRIRDDAASQAAAERAFGKGEVGADAAPQDGEDGRADRAEGGAGAADDAALAAPPPESKAKTVEEKVKDAKHAKEAKEKEAKEKKNKGKTEDYGFLDGVIDGVEVTVEAIEVRSFFGFFCLSAAFSCTVDI